MTVLITANQEDSHDYFIDEIIKKNPDINFVIIRQGKRENTVKNFILDVLGFLNLEHIIKNNISLAIDKRKKFKKYFKIKKDQEIKQIIGSINNPENINLIKRAKPLGLIVLGGKIICDEILESISEWSLHLHCGIVPFYRGGTTWYSNFSFEDYSNCGFTIQELDSGIDTGNIITQHQIKINKGESTWDAYCKCVVAGTAAINKLIAIKRSDALYAFSSIGIPNAGFNHTGKFLFDKGRLNRARRKMYCTGNNIKKAEGLHQPELSDFKHEFIF